VHRTDAAAALETLEVTGVVLSFIFVGHELRQNTQVARAAAVQAISDQSVQVILNRTRRACSCFVRCWEPPRPSGAHTSRHSGMTYAHPSPRTSPSCSTGPR
jgi:hypothetical protein